MALEPSTLLVRGALTVVSALAIVAIGLWVLWLNPRHRANRAFGLLALLLGLARLALGSVDLVAHDAGAFVTLQYATAAFALASTFAAMHFATLYPAPRLLGRVRGGGALLALAALLVLALLLPPFSTLDPGQFEDGLRRGVRGTGLIAIAPGISGLTFALLALLFAWQWGREGRPARSSLLLLFYGFTLGIAYNVSFFTVRDVLQFATYSTPWARANGFLFELTLVPLALGLWLVARERPLPRAWPVVLAAATGVAVALERGTRSDPGLWHAAFVGLWRVALPALVGYALLRGQLFDIDVRVKWGIQRGTTAAIFLATFIVVAQLAQNWLSEAYGWAVGGAVAGLMLFAIAPLQRAAEIVAQTALPDVRDPRPTGASEDEAAYRHAVEMALADGIVTRHEEKALHHLADRLGIGPARAWQIREEVERTLAAGP